MSLTILAIGHCYASSSVCARYNLQQMTALPRLYIDCDTLYVGVLRIYVRGCCAYSITNARVCHTRRRRVGGCVYWLVLRPGFRKLFPLSSCPVTAHAQTHLAVSPTRTGSRLAMHYAEVMLYTSMYSPFSILLYYPLSYVVFIAKTLTMLNYAYFSQIL